MCLSRNDALDKDDIYPRSYQWRMGDKYDPAKVDLVKTALRLGRRIEDTAEYEEYVEAISKSRIETISWD